MKDEIILREFQKKDTKAVINLIRQTWHYDEFSSPKTAYKLARGFLYSCLTNQTYTQVAIMNGTPVGIIMGKNMQTHRCPLKYRFQQLFAIASLYGSKEGRKVSKMFQNIRDIDQHLLKDCAKQYQGELAFFAVSASIRGKGVGKMLYQSFVNYMESQAIKNWYLFTDTSCNYGFYEHQGMVRRSEKGTSFYIKKQNAKMSFFLYDFSH